MLPEPKVPCSQCLAGLHRICVQPVKIPTLMAYLKGSKLQTSETLTCCDRKEFWINQRYD